jgi:hypothetical protein
MQPVEFITDLTPEHLLQIPRDIADKLPKSGRARVIVVPIGSLLAEDAEDAQWHAGAYEQFLRDDFPEDAVYDDY